MTGRSKTSRPRALRAYFRAMEPEAGFPPGSGLLGFAALLLLVGLASGSGSSSRGCASSFIVPGVLLGLWSGGRMFRSWSRRRRRLRETAAGPLDEEVQAWLDDDLDRVKERALLALGLSDEELVSELVTIVAPVLWSVDGIDQEDLLFRTGEDGCTRFGVYSLAVIALTQTNLGVFRCEYDFIQDAVRNERTCEYHYRDIVAVSTSKVSRSLRMRSGERPTETQEFRVSVPNGEAVRITVDAVEIRRMTGSDALPASGAEKAVRAIRAMLRQN